jgi:hypothetical protein
VLDPATQLAATLRRGRLIAGTVFTHPEFERLRSTPLRSR